MKQIRTINLSGLDKDKIMSPNEMKNVRGGSEGNKTCSGCQYSPCNYDWQCSQCGSESKCS